MTISRQPRRCRSGTLNDVVAVLEGHVERKQREIRTAMAALGRRIERGDHSDLVYWVIAGKLACAHRPLRYDPTYGGSGNRLPPAAMPLLTEWVELIKLEGIRSILSLMHDRDLNSYRSLPLDADDLLIFLERQGLRIAHHPYEDPAHKRTSPQLAKRTLLRVREAALASYDMLPKPVLIQCSAGEDRTAPIAAYILAREPSGDLNTDEGWQH